MLTRIEIDGFKTFDNFELDLQPFTAIVGPNASGKSNFFDALQLLSGLAEFDIHTAMQNLRGEPEELFRRANGETRDQIKIAAEVFLDKNGVDDFGRAYEIPSQRLRYQIVLEISRYSDGTPHAVFVRDEYCRSIKKKEDSALYLKARNPSYGRYSTPFIRSESNALLIRQDGPGKSGNPMRLPLKEAARSALSTIATAETPHLYALKKALRSIRFLEINPTAARGSNDRFEKTTLKPDASNLAAVLNRLRDQTRQDVRPNGVLTDIALDLSSLIPSVCSVEVQPDHQKQYSFSVGFSGDINFSSRVISDGTLRLLALLTILNDPDRKGTLCFEEPENGVHEGRIPLLIDLLRRSTEIDENEEIPLFQIIINTHSPTVMMSLRDPEIVASDIVSRVDPAAGRRATHTRMRTGVNSIPDLFDPERYLSRSEIDRLLRKAGEAG